ncbi:hypothetical protein V494_03620 [Pseudogymnoascus sp. VKM F-4513 (FW-928)]|nr:hypothetical protein V494_03620 [Pseudogymnoascus sp. VKM F-4513 (FW-928)]
MAFEFVDNNAPIDRAVRRRIRSHVAIGKNAGRTLVRPSRTKAAARETGTRSMTALVKIPRVVAGARNTEEEEQDSFSFVSRPYDAADLHTSVDTSSSPTSMWVQFMFLDEAFFHCAIAASVTARNGLVTEKDDPNEVLRHLSQSFRLINERLSGNNPVSDETIAVVVILAQHERIRGHYGEGLVHISGLERMVQLRGGVRALSKYRPGLTQKLFKVDLAYALHQGTATRFSAEDLLPSSTALFGRFSGTEIYYDQELSDLIDPELSKHLSTNLQTVFMDMNSLARLMNDASAGNCPKIKSYVFLDTINLLGYRLLQVSTLSRPNSFSYLENAVHVGLAIYIIAFQRGLDMKVSEVPLISNLARSLLRDHVSSEQVDREVILWILFIGQTSTFGEVDDIWVIPKMRETVRSLGIGSWEGVSKMLAKFPCVIDVHGKSAQALWYKSNF